MDQLYRAKKNQIKMVKTRGFVIEPDEELLLTMTLPQIRSYYETKKTDIRKAMSRVYTKGDVRLLVLYLECTGKSNQLGQQAVTTFITETRQNDCQQGIIIAPCLPTKEPNKDVIEALKKTTKSLVQIFCEIELNYDILSYVFQPRYEVLSEEKAAEFFKINKIQPTQMPVIRSYDPVAKYLGLFPGTVLKEYNTNLSGETMVDEYITYSIIQ